MPEVARKKHGSHWVVYLDDAKLPGVTSITGMLPKDNLISWAAKSAANCAIDEWDRLAELPPTARQSYIAGAPNRDRDEAGRRGKQVHALAERLVQGEKVDVPDVIAGHVEQCVRFFDDSQMRPLLTETSVVSLTHRYGGTFDLIGETPWQPGLVLCDFKTSRSGIWSETAVQLAGYRYAEHVLTEAGDLAPMPPVSACWAVWIRGDGYDVYPVEAGPDTHRLFLYLRQVWSFMQQRREEYVGDALEHTAVEVAS